jgi:hypothetical protein
LLKTSLAFGARKIPSISAPIETIVAPIMYGLKKRLKLMPELRMAIISVLLASFEVNQMIDKNRNIGKSILAK